MTVSVDSGLAPVRRALANGAVLIAQETAIHPAVTVQATLDAGSANDPAMRLGLASFTARVLDRGTEHKTAEQLARALDDRGVSLTIGVTRHLLSLTCTCLAEDLEPVVAILGEVVRCPVFQADQVERRRAEIITSLRQDEDNPAAMASEALMALIYPGGHPYGRPGEGTIASVEAIARGDLVAFHRAHVTPHGFRLVIVGDVEPARALDLGEAVFGDWVTPAPPRLVLPGLDATSRRRLEARHPIAGKAQSDIAYGFRAIRRHDERYHAVVVMNNVLGQYGLGGRLGESIRERQGLAYYVYSTFDGNVAEGPLVIRAGVNPQDVERAVRSIDAEVGRMGREGISARELEDARRYLVGSLPHMLETNADMAAFLHNAEYFQLGLDYDRRLKGLFESVTREAVADVARTFLRPDEASVVVAGSQSGVSGAAA